ncbi:hypothetical protein BUALT_Bualt14G0107100 [Buddleja alternifolia]|uniref:Ureidoglycolate hydrolase n=1 Tax=Buddleja alternifolia TaxID=168488 RepID=A0AAV6WTU1_9LAMI|nr:hypothetical protein BUALT_Bualt14G0107100 [Buddleja alternifolia]
MKALSLVCGLFFFVFWQLHMSVATLAQGNITDFPTRVEPGLGLVLLLTFISNIGFRGKFKTMDGTFLDLLLTNGVQLKMLQPNPSMITQNFESESGPRPKTLGLSLVCVEFFHRTSNLSDTLKDAVGNIFGSHIDAIPYSESGENNTDDLSTVFLKKGSYSAFVELHIEQGPILEEEATSIGVVTAIAAPASIKVDFEGNGGHAGAVLMPMSWPHLLRFGETGLAAAELALAVEKHVLESGSIDTVGTVGILELHPGAINSIPSKSHIEIDTRDIDEKRRNAVIEKIHQSALSISKKRGVKLSEFKIVNQDPPALSENSIIKATESACKELNLSYKKMISRAYHDSLFMARISPMGMIFIPCYKGYSHKPEEFAAAEDVANGVRVLALTLAKLSFS